MVHSSCTLTFIKGPKIGWLQEDFFGGTCCSAKVPLLTPGARDAVGVHLTSPHLTPTEPIRAWVVSLVAGDPGDRLTPTLEIYRERARLANALAAEEGSLCLRIGQHCWNLFRQRMLQCVDMRVLTVGKALVSEKHCRDPR